MTLPSKKLHERARVVDDIHAFFRSRDFLHVETPAIVPSPGMDVHLSAFAVDVNKRKRHWLATSPEYQMKRLLAADHARIYQVCRSYRQDEEGHLHNPEFSMLEWYRAEASMMDVMKDTEQLVARVTKGSIDVRGKKITTLPPFDRVTVCQAFQNWADVSPDDTLAMADHDEDQFFRVLVEKIEPTIAAIGRPIFLTEYPASMASLARKKIEDVRVVERFELYLAGIELCNGFGELTDPDEQRARFENDQRVRKLRGLEVYPIDEKFIEAMRSLKPCAGNALGIDRLAMLASGAEAIAEVMAFAWDEL